MSKAVPRQCTMLQGYAKCFSTIFLPLYAIQSWMPCTRFNPRTSLRNLTRFSTVGYANVLLLLFYVKRWKCRKGVSCVSVTSRPWAPVSGEKRPEWALCSGKSKWINLAGLSPLGRGHHWRFQWASEVLSAFEGLFLITPRECRWKSDGDGLWPFIMCGCGGGFFPAADSKNPPFLAFIMRVLHVTLYFILFQTNLMCIW